MELASSILIAGKVAFAAVGLLAGTRLAGLARREGGLGPSGLAATMILVGGAGLAAITVGERLGETSLATIVAIGGEIAMRLGIAGLFVFVAWVFHPGRFWAAAAAVGGIGLLGASLAWDYASQSHWSRYDPSLPSYIASQLSIALPFAWGTFETGSQWLRSRRQLRLGIGDPVISNRFLLWTVACICFAAICGLGTLAGWAYGAGHHTLTAWVTACRGLLYLPIVVAVWLGMFAPAAYEQGLRDRHAGAPAPPDGSDPLRRPGAP